MKTVTTYQLGPGCQKVLAAYIAFFVFLVVLIILSGCVRMPLPVIPDEALCPCPEFVLSMGGVLIQGQDPDEPPPCTVATNCGRHLPVAAETLPGCQREAQERAGREG